MRTLLQKISLSSAHHLSNQWGPPLNAVIQRAQAALDRAARDLSHTAVLAPFDGFVADVRLALGKRVAVGESLGRLLAADPTSPHLQ